MDNLLDNPKIIGMIEASKIAAECLDAVENILKVGITTELIHEFCLDFLKDKNARAAALGYHGFPKSVCVSINNEVCHGIPSPKRIIQNGDLVKVDFVVEKNGYFGDTCRSYVIGNNPLASKLLEVCYNAMWTGIKMVKPGVDINDIGTAIEKYALTYGFSSVKDYCGHGIGEAMHMDPKVPHFNTGRPGVILKEGMFFTIEPMITAGKEAVKVLSDHWTVVTKDLSIAAQWEHTIMVLKDGYQVLTLSNKEHLTFIK